VYAVGAGAYYYYTDDPKEIFGYGLISKLDPNTGEGIASFMLGSDRYDADFTTAFWTGSGLTCAGWTEYEVNGGPCRGWLCTVNVSGASVPAGIQPAVAAPGGSTRGDAALPPASRQSRNAR